MQIARHWAKADAKVQQISIPSKFFGDFFQSLTKVFGIIDKTKDLQLINIYKGRPFCISFYQKSISLTQDTKQVNKEVNEVEIK